MNSICLGFIDRVRSQDIASDFLIVAAYLFVKYHLDMSQIAGLSFRFYWSNLREFQQWNIDLDRDPTNKFISY